MGRSRMLSPAPSAHPRWRGAHEQKRRLLQAVVGSSPLARGTSDEVVKLVGAGGLIPAGAGHMLDDLHLQQDRAHSTFNSEQTTRIFLSYLPVLAKTPSSSPSIARPVIGSLIIRPHHESNAIKISRDPIMIVSAEFHVLLIIRGKDQQCPSISAQLSGSFPE